ncbi:MAG: hypothetical protein IKB53_04825 [Oscillospiraceae bacterium]|nr:hypothetical protein [Oscillospiraceae bacterium]
MKNWPSKQAKIRIVNQIISAASDYKMNLVGKTFLYWFEGRYIEVVYRARDFSHLTGVETSLSANDFYKEAVRGTLRDTQIWFSKRHPHSLCVRKMSHLLQFVKITNSPLLILESITTDTAIYKFGLTELECTVCLDHDLDDLGIPKSNMLIAKSLRDEDSFGRGQDAFEVNMIFCKANDAKLYDRCTFDDGKYSKADLSEEVVEKLSPALFLAT